LLLLLVVLLWSGVLVALLSVLQHGRPLSVHTCVCVSVCKCVYTRIWICLCLNMCVRVWHSTCQSIYTNCKCQIHLSKFKLWLRLRLLFCGFPADRCSCLMTCIVFKLVYMYMCVCLSACVWIWKIVYCNVLLKNLTKDTLC